MKDPVEVRLPSRNRILVIPRVNKSRDSMTAALLGDLLLYFCNSPAIGSMISGRALNEYRWSNSRRQLIYRITHGLAEVA